MKTGMSQVGEIGGLGELFNPSTVFRIFTNVYVIGGLLLYATAFFLWLGALSSLNVSLMYPLLSLAYVVTAMLVLRNVSLVIMAFLLPKYRQLATANESHGST